MKSALVLSFIGLVLLLAGCDRPGDVSGQVFIVTKGGNNVRLGLVRIRLYAADIFEKVNGEAKAAVEKRRKSIDEEVLRLQNERQQLEAKLESADFAGRIDSQKRANNALYQPKIRELKEREKETAERIGNFDEILLSMLPSPALETKTDADGKFKISIKRKGAYVVVASASRELPTGKAESYQWFIHQTIGHEPISLTLSNDNLQDTQ